MSTLSRILGLRTTSTGPEGDSGLEQGRIWVYTPGTRDATLFCDFCWQAPSSGEAVIEIWGAGGSTGRQCCCGGGSLPGNPGAYSKKTVCVSEGSFVCGIVGLSCGNAGARDFRGCSQSTCIVWQAKECDGCMCAEGGQGGCSRCSTGTPPFCCLVQRGYCNTLFGNGCGIVCNWMPVATDPGDNNSFRGRAFGGDINCCGGISCSTIMHCSPNNYCCAQYHIAVPPGVFSDDGVVITYQGEGNVDHGCWTGGGTHAVLHGLAVAGKNPVRGGLYVSGCWTGGVKLCGCYEDMGCLPFFPYGMGGNTAQVVANIRDQPTRGGHGAVRIKFIGTN